MATTEKAAAKPAPKQAPVKAEEKKVKGKKKIPRTRSPRSAGGGIASVGLDLRCERQTAPTHR